MGEQRAIVDFLDREGARIDARIEKKTRFVELLREKKGATAAASAMAGIGQIPDGGHSEAGHSEVPWFGNVPAHWKTVRIAALFREVSREGDAELPVLSISIHSGISDDELSDNERDRKVALIEDRTTYKRVRPGDLAYNMMRAWQGAFGAVAVDGLVSPAYVVAEPRGNLNSKFVELLLRTPQAIEEMRRYSRGIAGFRMRLYWEAFRDIRIAVPPNKEQEEIVQHVAAAASRIDALVDRTEKSIALLRERRAALITAAVTGQLDLRTPHPAEAPEPA